MRRKHRPHGEDVEAIRRPRATAGLEFPLILNGSIEDDGAFCVARRSVVHQRGGGARAHQRQPQSHSHTLLSHTWTPLQTTMEEQLLTPKHRTMTRPVSQKSLFSARGMTDHPRKSVLRRIPPPLISEWMWICLLPFCAFLSSSASPSQPAPILHAGVTKECRCRSALGHGALV